MALTNFKNKPSNEFDEGQRLMCSAHDCQNFWSVQMDGDTPRCSKHQWERAEKKITVQSWYDVGEKF